MMLCTPNEKQDEKNPGRSDFQIIRKSTLALERIMVSSGSLTAHCREYDSLDFQVKVSTKHQIMLY